MYNFDKIIDRSTSNAYKYVNQTKVFGKDHLIPLWVADMDFETPPFIVEALLRRMEHPVFGYTCIPEELWPTVVNWLERRHGWKTQEKWMSFIPGIVKGIGMAINVLVGNDEKVIIQPPVYHPFRLTPLGNGREVVYNPLIREEDGTYRMDFEQLASVCDEKCRMLILCNPHNPGGVLWDRATLERLADFCYSHHIIVISDEIHSDMALWGKQHIPFASVSEKAAQCSITFGAPSKTFNIAGVVSSFAVVPNDELRSKFYGWMEVNELNMPDIFAPIATIAAFKYGEEWREEMLRYIEGNVEFVEHYCRQYLPAIHPQRPEASFLIWMDCKDLHLQQGELVNLFVDKAGLALNRGDMFGKEGNGFMRMNVGVPRSVLEQAMNQLKAAVDQL